MRVAAGEGPGVLEIKCPFNRGRPQQGRPPAQPPWYYMPQVVLVTCCNAATPYSFDGHPRHQLGPARLSDLRHAGPLT